MPNNTRVSWEAGSTIQLARVPWDTKDVPYWETNDARDRWFSQQAVANNWPQWTNNKFLRVGEPFTIDMPYSEVYPYNYVTVTNPAELGAEGGEPTFLFYFITSATPTSRGGTTITVDLDIWTTRINSVTFGQAYLARGHALMADVNANRYTEATLPRILNTYYSVDEGLSVGDELIEVDKEVLSIDNVTGDAPWVILVSTAALEMDFGSVNNPKLRTARGNLFDGMVSGTSSYAIRPNDFVSLMEAMQGYPWITQNIVAIYTVPSRMVNVDENSKVYFGGIAEGSLGAKYIGYRLDSTGIDTVGYADLSKLTSDESFPTSQAWASDLKKLWNAPYSCVVIENALGSSVALKPNLFPTSKLPLVMYSTLMYPFMRACVMPRFYAGALGKEYAFSYRNLYGGGLVQNGTVSSGDFMATALWFADFPSFAIVNNDALAAIASRAHDIAATRTNASLNRSQAGKAIETQLRNTSANLTTQLTNQQISNDLAIQKWQNQAPVSVATGAIGGAIGGAGAGPVGVASGAVIGGATAAVNAYVQAENIAATNEASMQMTRNSVAAAAGNANRNAALANAQANLDYANAMRSLNAGIADAALTSPSISGQAGGNGFAYKIGTFSNVYVKYMRPTPQFVESVGMYWKRYGYATNRFVDMGKTPLSLMTYVTYWQCAEIYLECGSMDETEKNALRGMFNRGLSVWSNPNEIGRISPRYNRPVKEGVYFD